MEKKKIYTIGMNKVVSYFWKMNMKQKRLFFACILGIIIASITVMYIPIYYAKMIDTITSFSWNIKTQTVHQLIIIVFIIFWLEVGRQIGWRTFGCSIIPLETRSQMSIISQCFQYLHKHSYRFFSNNFSWALTKKVNKLAWSYESVTDIFMIELLRLIIMLPFIIIVVFSKSRILWSIFLAFVLVYGTIQYFFYRWNLPYEIISNEHDSKITWELADTIGNNFNILTFASLPREIKKFGDTLKERGNMQSKTRYRGELIHLTSGALLIIFEFVAIYITVKLWWLSLISAGTIVLVQTYVIKLFDQMSWLDNIFKRLNKSVGDSAEMLEILETPHEIQDKTDKKLNIKDGKVEFNHVDFWYNPDKPILAWYNLRIQPWEKIAIVGASGWWKTTIVKLLFRFFDIQWGEILIDGQNIADVKQDSLRSSLSMIPQDPVLFHRSIKENISYGNPEATDEEIIAAAKMARCHEFIQGLKNGYETTVWERGIKLSWGERQRVAIARAILENKRILVMDEATSSLDSESEHLIQEAMDEVLRNKTAIVIAHRLSTIMKMDRIIVMEDGKIIESWSHHELLAKEHGTYKKLRDIQSWGFLK